MIRACDTITRMGAYEYRRATWDEVCALGPQGWRLVPVPPIVEMKNVLGQMQAGEPMYAMEREAPEVRANPDATARQPARPRSLLLPQ